MRRRIDPWLGVVVVLLSLCGWSTVAAEPAVGDPGIEAPEVGESPIAPGRAAVAAPSMRLSLGYGFAHIDRIVTQFSTPTAVTTAILGDRDFQFAGASLAATIPLTDSTGMRASIGSSYDWQRLSLDRFGPGHDGSNSYDYRGALDFFLRDPDFGELALGPSLTRTSYPDEVDSNTIGSSLAVSAFFPDLGLGPTDWRLDFDYGHEDFSGPGVDDDLDIDRYQIEGGATWYLADAIAAKLGGRWVRSESDVNSTETSVGVFRIGGLIRFISMVSLEPSLGVEVGTSKFKQSPFRADQSFAWSISTALTFRLAAGQSLVALARHYD